MSLFSKTTMGLIKAMGFLGAEPEKKKQKRDSRPKFVYSDYATAVHGKRYIRPDERKTINALVDQIKEAADEDQRKALLGDLRGMPVQFVRVRRADRLDYSRYTGADLRDIAKAGGGPKERARAEKRRAAMSPVALAA